ncbi:hypothetical protein Leryth_024157 [Lithospermum erythrorhizon]|uniref:Glycosyltransferase n=1 Tax=Lithospermum erythrorhizon TaxID=34254 RepID=A0AAV3NWA1_LITER|nr:hypothetical protein Leryth_024157 [Lithospermum erythrorhizon]
MDFYRDELDESLSKAATTNKTVILTVVNKAYIEGEKPMLDLFLDGFWLGEDTRGLIDHLLVVAVDKSSYDRCMFLKLHCYKLKTDGVEFESEQFFMSHDFIKMMWRRTLFLRDVLNYGYNFIFTDTDVLWLRNPLLKLNSDERSDLQISTDWFNGDERSEGNLINTGFYMVRSSNKTIALFDEWYRRKEVSQGLKEQDVLLFMMREGMFRTLGLNVKFLDTRYFSGFCELTKDFDAVTTVHSNCCRTINAKLLDLTTVTNKWREYRSPSRNPTSVIRWTVPRDCVESWQISSPELSPMPGPWPTPLSEYD